MKTRYSGVSMMCKYSLCEQITQIINNMNGFIVIVVYYYVVNLSIY